VKAWASAITAGLTCRCLIRPRILYLASSWPGASGYGGQLRALHIGRALKEVGQVSLIVVSSDAPDAAARDGAAAEFTLLPAVNLEPRPNRGLAQKLRWAFDTRYLNVHGCAVSPADSVRVAAAAAEHDLVWVLNARTPNLLSQWHWPHAHLDLDDVPSTYLRTVHQNGADRPGRLKARVQQQLFKRRELRFRERFTTLSVCSTEDRAYLGNSDQIHVIPNGFSRPATEPRPQPATNPPRLGFIGLGSFPPNVDGVGWFLRECWPAIRAVVPGIRFRLAGKDTDRTQWPAAPDVDVLGWLEDPADEIASWSAMVIPVRFGGGTRIKLADAFSRKCPVVSTGLGAFGYAVEQGRQLLIADAARDFASACVELVRNPTRGRELAGAAWQDFLQHWTWDAIAPKVWSAAEDCLRRSRDQSRKLKAEN